jgi:UDP-glucose 4-epimerase
MPGDITCYDSVCEAAQDIDYIFHCAAQGTRHLDGSDPLEIHRSCATGTLHVLEAARLARSRRVIYASTGYVYGSPSASPVREDDSTQPLSPYASSKLAGELHCVAFTRAYGLSTVRLRYFHLFGPGQPQPSRYAQDFLRILAAMLAGERPVVCVDRWGCPELLYVADAAHAAVLAAETDRLAARVYNIAQGRYVRPAEIVDALNQILGTHLAPVLVSAHRDPGLNYLADISLAEGELGYCPATSLVQALRACVDYYTAHADELEECSWSGRPVP